MQYCLHRSCWHAINEKAFQEELSTFRRGLYEERQAYFKAKYQVSRPVAGSKKIAIKSSKQKLKRNDCNGRIKSCRKVGPYSGHAHRYDMDPEYRQQCMIHGIPRMLVVRVFDASGKDTGEIEVLEDEYIRDHPWIDE